MNTQPQKHDPVVAEHTEDIVHLETLSDNFENLLLPADDEEIQKTNVSHIAHSKVLNATP